MALTQVSVRDAAKALAQSGVTSGLGISVLLSEPGDYNLAITQALKTLDLDRPNRRLKDVTVSTAGFRFVLSGTGAVLPTTGLDQWIDGQSDLEGVYLPYDVTVQAQEPLDENAWRLVEFPDGTRPGLAIELLEVSAAVGNVLRFVYRAPHVLHATDATLSTVRAADEQALVTIAAAWTLQMAANKAVQNTGNTGLPNDVVDRRSQSDIFRSRAKELRDLYATFVGKGSGQDLKGASAIKDLDVLPSHRSGFLWHPTWGH